jgi:5-methylcytosine-specific restriction endonuclease McrA
VAAWLNQKGFTVGADWKSVAYHSVVLWHADHILPLAEGGTNALANIRTLCVPCRKAETAALARRLAEARRLAAGKPVQVPLAGFVS